MNTNTPPGNEPRTVSLALTEANRSALEQFIQLCARE